MTKCDRDDCICEADNILAYRIHKFSIIEIRLFCAVHVTEFKNINEDTCDIQVRDIPELDDIEPREIDNPILEWLGLIH